MIPTDDISILRNSNAVRHESDSIGNDSDSSDSVPSAHEVVWLLETSGHDVNYTEVYSDFDPVRDAGRIYYDSDWIGSATNADDMNIL